MMSMAKHSDFWSRGHELIFVLGTRSFAEFEESVSVEGGGVGVDGGIMHGCWTY